MQTPEAWFERHARRLAAMTLLALLSACGGAQPESTATSRDDTTSPALARGATMNQAELADAERRAQAADAALATPLDALPEGQIAAKRDYVSGAVVRKAAAVRIPVYRFYNSSTGAHFFTSNTAERDNVIATLSPPFLHEGEAFRVASAFSPGLSPVHRFYNTQTGVHFYTISESERASVAATLPQFIYEGIAYHASQVNGQGLTPIYRFYVPSRGFHFYTANNAEKDSIIANLAAIYSFEGIGYYVLDANWTAEKLPHTGVTDQQCYQTGSDTLLSCGDSGATTLNPQQDGHLVTHNTMSYSADGSNPLTSCVKDHITGLVWEVKSDDGGWRDKDNTYTHQGGGAATDASGYVAAVNAARLCGYSDWRLPTRQELLHLIDYGRSTGPKLDTTWFPNTASALHWSADGAGDDAARAWRVGFSATGGNSLDAPRTGYSAVRLVRGAAATGTRFTYSTIAYAGDAADNVVNDAWTGLQWRRCEEGRVWSGSSCTGNASTFTHEQALAHARDQGGWRLPNVKELASLTDLSPSSGPLVDATAFPGAGLLTLWSSSPNVNAADTAWAIGFLTGTVRSFARSELDAVRLVRVGQ